MSYMSLDAHKVIGEIRLRVIRWEKDHWAPYPWRVERTPYKVLVAEILLKRTTRQAVSREFLGFIKRFPNIYSIYSADVEELEEALKHLGLYKQRTQHLKELAKAIVEKHGGVVPDRWEDLVALPGLGIYITGAVLSFGFGKRAPVVDSNVARLLSRLTGLRPGSPARWLGLLWVLVPEEGHDYFNYGLIDLGALVCHYKKPRCGQCPLRDLCVHYMAGVDEKRAKELKALYEALYKEAQAMCAKDRKC